MMAHCCSWIDFIRSSLLRQFRLFLLLCMQSSFNKALFYCIESSLTLWRVDYVQSTFFVLLYSYSVILERNWEFSLRSLYTDVVTSWSFNSKASFYFLPTIIWSLRLIIYSYFLFTYSSRFLTFSSNCSQIYPRDP